MDSLALPDGVKNEGKRKRAPPPLKVTPPTLSPELFVRRIPIPLLSPVLEDWEMEERKAGNEEESGSLEAVQGRMGCCVEKGWLHPASPGFSIDAQLQEFSAKIEL